MGEVYNTSQGSQSGSSGSSSYGSTSTGLSPAQILSSYQNYLPGTLQALNSANASQLSGGAGTQAATAGNALQRQLNPEYYQALGTANQGATAGVNASNNLLNAVNLNGLSPGEYNATERGVNQYNTGTGNAGLANPTNTISNAMNFGGAFNNKIGIAANAIGANTGAVNAASGVGSAASPNVSGFNPTQMATGNNFANQFLTGITSVGSGQNASTSSSVNQADNKGWGCCFIFLESYHGTLPNEVRIFRDHYYKFQPRIADGYKRMAKWLVPLMRKYAIVRNVVWYCMVKPATNYCKHTVPGINKFISRFWLKLWAIYGRN